MWNLAKLISKLGLEFVLNHRHEKPTDPDDPLADQNIKDRYYGINDPVADKLLKRASAMPRLDTPDDKSITTLYVGGLGDTITDSELRWDSLLFCLIGICWNAFRKERKFLKLLCGCCYLCVLCFLVFPKWCVYIMVFVGEITRQLKSHLKFVFSIILYWQSAVPLYFGSVPFIVL